MNARICLAALAALVAAGCQTAPQTSVPAGPTTSDDNARIARSLDPLANWQVNPDHDVWKVLISRSIDGLPPKHAGYLVRRQYRKSRRAPVHEVYEVTTINRNQVVGQIDGLGRAVRFEPRRNAGVERVDVGVNTLENSVGAIFDTTERITLEKTSERSIAFERMDRDGNGVLGRDEVDRYGASILRADANGDGKIDRNEFNAIDRF